jgi:hypothetical protein
MNVPTTSTQATSNDATLSPVLAGMLWLWVVVPFGYGLYQLVVKIPALFGS